MDYHIKAITLNDERFKRYSLKNTPEGVSDKTLANLSKINIFVGENNSGKSIFLRHLAATQLLEFVPHIKLGEGFSWEMLSKLDKEFRDNVNHCFASNRIADANNIRQQLSTIPSLQYLHESKAPIPQLLNHVKRISEGAEFGTVSYTSTGGLSRGDAQSLARELRQFATTFLENLRQSPNLEKVPEYRFTKLYIPTLRGLRAFTGAKDSKGGNVDVYRDRTVADYFATQGGFQPEIFTGLTLYDECQRLLLGNLADRSKIRSFERFIGKTFFHGREIALIPKLNKGVLDIKIGDEEERPIYLLGDGIQAIIILTFPLYMNRDKKMLVFCEEPELYMHPGLQRVLLSVLSSKEFPENQYFLTTHSNHFLDLTLDIESVSVFTFRKELEGEGTEVEKTARFEIENVSNEDSRSLQLLGVRNSSVFLSNCTVWVEGITDRRYFWQYLSLYQDTLKGVARFKEDLHYSFVEYGGSNITHFSFLDSTPDAIVVDRLCGRLFLITDEDNATGTKAARHNELKEKLKERYCCLECKEVENLLSPKIIKLVVAKYEKGTPEFNEFQQEDYQKVSLGEFIDTKVLKTKSTRTASYAKDNSLRDKTDFCEKAVEEMKTFGDLSPEAQAIAKQLYDFIAGNNR